MASQDDRKSDTLDVRSLDALRTRLRQFTAERDWEQFHSPKNLAMALIAEAGELVEHFQWLTEAQSRDLPAATRDKLALELADVLIQLIRLSDVIGVDMIKAAYQKLEINQSKYPAERVRGNSTKYSEYES